MKTCKCGHQCARNARVCPDCGHRFTSFVTKAVAWMFGIMAGIGFLVIITEAFR
jgi:hypothetical protein